MADVWQMEQGRRLFGIVAADGSLGGIAGPALTTLQLEWLEREALVVVSPAPARLMRSTCSRYRRFRPLAGLERSEIRPRTEADDSLRAITQSGSQRRLQACPDSTMAGLDRCRLTSEQAAVGFEPTHNGFAIRPLSPLGYAAEVALHTRSQARQVRTRRPLRSGLPCMSATPRS